MSKEKYLDLQSIIDVLPEDATIDVVRKLAAAQRSATISARVELTNQFIQTLDRILRTAEGVREDGRAAYITRELESLRRSIRGW